MKKRKAYQIIRRSYYRENRSGARGTVELIFKKEYNKFSSISKEGGNKMTDAFTDV